MRSYDRLLEQRRREQMRRKEDPDNLTEPVEGERCLLFLVYNPDDDCYSFCGQFWEYSVADDGSLQWKTPSAEHLVDFVHNGQPRQVRFTSAVSQYNGMLDGCMVDDIQAAIR